MGENDAAAVVVAVASGIAAVVLVWAAVSLAAAVKELRRTVEQLRAEALPAVADLRATVGSASAELERVDGLLGTAENVSATVDSASRLAYLALSNPVIKALAFASGSSRAVRRLRSR